MKGVKARARVSRRESKEERERVMYSWCKIKISVGDDLHA